MQELFTSSEFATLLQALQQCPCEDRIDAWPTDQFSRMAEAGVMKWDQPEQWGYVANRINAAVRRESRRVAYGARSTPETIAWPGKEPEAESALPWLGRATEVVHPQRRHHDDEAESDRGPGKHRRRPRHVGEARHLALDGRVRRARARPGQGGGRSQQ